MSIDVGDLVRHYRVVEHVGEGGMGVVYRAHDTRLGRDVALKVLHHAAPMTPERRDRLQREGRAIAALNHPNILTIHDIGEIDGMPFLVFEWVDGGTLADTLPRQMSPDAFLRLAIPIADALACAHDHGIVHRDVKPANVLLTSDGRVKLADFGLARAFDTSRDATRTAGVLGTVAYMSPEQGRGLEIGPPSDIFSFGVLAYEVLAGHLPAPGASELRRDVPGALSSIVERCLEVDTSRRFASGRELARALRALEIDDLATRRVPALPGNTTASATPARAPQIRFCTTADGVSIAWSACGSGPVIVRVLGHFTHLELEWDWPDLRRFWEELAQRDTVVRYDGRGMGLSDPYDGDFTEDVRQLDLDAVLAAIGAPEVALLGISEGGWTAALYATRHPGRVTHLVLYGAYCRGAQARAEYDPEEDAALVTLIRKGWGRDTPAFRQVFTSQFFRRDADPGLMAHFNELQRASATPETAARYYESLHRRGDGRDLFRQVSVPTLVVHSRDDIAVSAEEGRLLASTIPGAELVLLPSGSHYFPTDARAATLAAGAIHQFLQTRRGVKAP
jgi:pimeloyl-ACP methyl ester carboxylesterase